LRVLGFCRAGLEAEAAVSGLDVVASVGEPIEESGGHLCVAKDGPPFAEAEIGGDDDAGSLVELAQQVEEQCAARGVNGRYLAAIIYKGSLTVPPVFVPPTHLDAG